MIVYKTANRRDVNFKLDNGFGTVYGTTLRTNERAGGVSGNELGVMKCGNWKVKHGSV